LAANLTYPLLKMSILKNLNPGLVALIWRIPELLSKVFSCPSTGYKIWAFVAKLEQFQWMKLRLDHYFSSYTLGSGNGSAFQYNSWRRTRKEVSEIICLVSSAPYKTMWTMGDWVIWGAVGVQYLTTVYWDHKHDYVDSFSAMSRRTCIRGYIRAKFEVRKISWTEVAATPGWCRPDTKVLIQCLVKWIFMFRKNHINRNWDYVFSGGCL